MATAILWCCHVRGPDDVVAAPDYDTALRWADVFNEWMATRLDVHPLDPRSNAVPALWPWSPEQHAADLAETNHEYAGLKAAPPKGDRAKFFPNDLVVGWSSDNGTIHIRRTADQVSLEVTRVEGSVVLRLRPDQALRVARGIKVAATTSPLSEPEKK